MSPAEPRFPRARVFVDGQNLYRGAKEAFGYHYPNYEVQALGDKLCHEHGWQLNGIYFYTGVPDTDDDAFWHHFWNAKMAVMGRKGIHVFSRSLRYRNKEFKLPDGKVDCTGTGPLG